jgi:hypothetical protein
MEALPRYQVGVRGPPIRQTRMERAVAHDRQKEDANGSLLHEVPNETRDERPAARHPQEWPRSTGIEVYDLWDTPCQNGRR